MIRRTSVVALLLVLFAIGWWVGRGRASSDLYANLDLFVEILHRVETNYVDPVDSTKLIDGAIKGLVKQLDPFSQYLEAKSYTNLQSVTTGTYGGVGIEITIRDQYPTVISPIEGSPAWEAGIRSGDVIVGIDGLSTLGFTIDDAATHLRGPQGTPVSLKVRREGETDEHDFALKRREITTKSVPYAYVLPGGIGYLRLANFSEQSGGEVRAALGKLHKDGAKSLVLDMRRNPGGLLDQAVDVAEQFLPDGVEIVSTHGRAAGEERELKAHGTKPELGWPLAVLVDEGSASASEIVAGALQDLDRGLIVGRTTFGKGSVQRVYPLRGPNAALKLTTARYYTPSGRSIHRAHGDSLAAALIARDDDDDDATPAAAPDSARPVYKTRGGRIVYGGGGITPDIAVLADTLPPLALAIERRGLTARFANRWLNQHPEAGLGATLAPEVWRDFAAFLAQEHAAGTDSALRVERPRLELALRREMARRQGGNAMASRIALEGDPVFERARAALVKAKSPRDVFAVADLPAKPLAAPKPAAAAPAKPSGPRGRGGR